jgi:4,5:9,10-diseco-3-hydroxy-5,9,17-trioxoandrosta-1(10),2-diene-4-oate hydrolase
MGQVNMGSDIQSFYLEHGDTLTHYYAAGEGEPLVLLHGGGSDSRQWLDTMQELSRHYRVYAPDLPGFGKSGSLPGTFGLHRLSRFVDRFLTELGLHQVRLLGHSLGGFVALSYVLESPQRVERLVLVDSLGLGGEIAWWVKLLCVPLIAIPLKVLARGAWHALGRLVALRPHISLPHWLSGIYPPHPAQEHLGPEVAGMAGQKTDLSHRLSEISVPTLIVWGGRDGVLPVRQAHRAHRLIRGSRLRVFEKGGHSAYRDQAHQFHRTLLEFLSQGAVSPEREGLTG